jgi:hypothetical protein
MSKTTTAIPDTEGKPAAIAAGATHATTVALIPTIVGMPSSPANASKSSDEQSEDDLFDLSRKIEALLKGTSNKNALKVLNMVGSLHGIRAISVDRPIGQPAAKAPAPKKEQKTKSAKGSGNSQAKAAYKQTPEYIRVTAERKACVQALKSTPAGDAQQSTLQSELRRLEQELKALKPRPGN